MMLKVVFFGTPDIGLKSLEYLYNSRSIDITAVVTQPDKPAGRGNKIKMSPIKCFAIEHDIPVYQPKSIRKEPDIIKALKSYEPDFFVTFAFGQILSQEVLDIPKYETINLHASLLPKYRGANPIQRAIINGDTETGICTMITELGLDCGDICKKLVIPISENMNCEDLYAEISEKSPRMIEETLFGLVDGTIKPVNQSDKNVCIAPKLKKEECEIDFSRSASSIHNLIRGVYKSPSAFFVYNNKIIKVLNSKVSFDTGNPGDIIEVTKEGVKFACGENALLITRVKPEGKSEMSARDWYNGLKNIKV